MKLSKVRAAASGAFVCIGISCLVVSCASLNNQATQSTPSIQSISPSAGIEDTKEGIINALKDNYDLFQETATFLENEPENFSCFITDLNDRQITVDIGRNQVDINSLSIGNDLSKIIKEYGFQQIVKYQDMIYFKKQAALAEYAPSVEIGLLYSTEGKEIILDITNSGAAGTTLIQGKWYYYYLKYPDRPYPPPGFKD